jgi:hypothetical protein
MNLSRGSEGVEDEDKEEEDEEGDEALLSSEILSKSSRVDTAVFKIVFWKLVALVVAVAVAVVGREEREERELKLKSGRMDNKERESLRVNWAAAAVAAGEEEVEEERESSFKLIDSTNSMRGWEAFLLSVASRGKQVALEWMKEWIALSSWKFTSLLIWRKR